METRVDISQKKVVLEKVDLKTGEQRPKSNTATHIM
jgi:hypothetical protein